MSFFDFLNPKKKILEEKISSLEQEILLLQDENKQLKKNCLFVACYASDCIDWYTGNKCSLNKLSLDMSGFCSDYDNGEEIKSVLKEEVPVNTPLDVIESAPNKVSGKAKSKIKTNKK